MTDILCLISEQLQLGEYEKVTQSTLRAVKAHVKPEEILNRGLIHGMNVVGERYRNHEIFLPHVLLAAKAMNAGIEILKPLFLKGNLPNRGRVVIGVVRGDLHDIGKNLVSIMLQGAGFKVIDLGNDVPALKFVETAQEENASVIGMSALLTTTMLEMKKVVDLLREKGLSGEILTLIGGAPVSTDFASEIGADAYGYDSACAVECVKRLMNKKLP